MSGYVQARSGLGNRGIPMWRHECGHVECFEESQRTEFLGGCDACESGSDNSDDWQPLYLAASSTPTPDPGGQP